jgi:apolipoprotein D and lipocalin family protein
LYRNWYRNSGTVIRTVILVIRGTVIRYRNSVEGSNNAKLRVSFFGPFYGDYWVLDRAEDYSWAIVGEPSGRYLWLLHRQAKPGDAALKALAGRAEAMGYNMQLLRWTRQAG